MSHPAAAMSIRIVRRVYIARLVAIAGSRYAASRERRYPMDKTLDEIKAQVWSHFGPGQCVYLATAEGVQPRVRPVTLLNLEEKFWIATSPRSAKARQVLRNPNVEFCFPLTAECGQGYIRISGIASVVRDSDMIERIGSQIPFLTQYWTGTQDPDFCLIRITRVEVEYLEPGGETAHTFIV
jgi:general stress protein 26